MTRWICALVVAVVAVSGCSTGVPVQGKGSATWARFFLEAADGALGTEVTLPVSTVTLTVNSKPVLTEGDIVNVELVQVDLGKCLAFELTPAAARDFHRLSGSHQGRRLALVVNDEAIGARRIDGAIADGVVFVFVELPDERLPELVDQLKKSAAARQRDLRRNG